jgi:hypothetical protein
MWGISVLSEGLLASKGGLYCMVFRIGRKVYQLMRVGEAKERI